MTCYLCKKPFLDEFVDVPGMNGKQHRRDPYIMVDFQLYSGKEVGGYGAMYPLTGTRPFYMCISCGTQFIQNLAKSRV